MLRLLKRIARFLMNRLSFVLLFRRFAAGARMAGHPAVLWHDRFPQLNDNTGNTGFDRHYIYHTAWAARVLATTRPTKHIDISSYLYFSTLVSAFLPVEFYDYRPARIDLSGLTAKHADLLSLSFESDSIASVSCMHVVEHIGLGRYGDPLDIEGDIKAVKELSRIVKPNGDLLIVLPVGKEYKVCFNAHRIYTRDRVLSLFTGSFNLVEFAFIEEHGEGSLIIDPTLDILNRNDYGCGCFWFKKK